MVDGRKHAKLIKTIDELLFPELPSQKWSHTETQYITLISQSVENALQDLENKIKHALPDGYITYSHENKIESKNNHLGYCLYNVYFMESCGDVNDTWNPILSEDVLVLRLFIGLHVILGGDNYIDCDTTYFSKKMSESQYDKAYCHILADEYDKNVIMGSSQIYTNYKIDRAYQFNEKLRFVEPDRSYLVYYKPISKKIE